MSGATSYRPAPLWHGRYEPGPGAVLELGSPATLDRPGEVGDSLTFTRIGGAWWQQVRRSTRMQQVSYETVAWWARNCGPMRMTLPPEPPSRRPLGRRRTPTRPYLED